MALHLFILLLALLPYFKVQQIIPITLINKFPSYDIIALMNAFTILNLLDLDLKEHDYLSLSCVSGRSGLSRVITNPKINRPGLALSGFFDDFSEASIQVFGHGEILYTKLLEEKNNYKTFEKLFSFQLPCIIFCEGATPSDYLKELSETNAIPILKTDLNSSDFSRRLYALLDEVFAKTETIHGVLVEVFGIGVLITGDSGIGKSETALELVERGHRLISDDAVKLKNISDTMLIGSGANPEFAHNMEIRGIGIIDLRNIYGVGAIREKKEVQLVTRLELWDPNKNYDRIGGAESETFLGVTIPKVVIPVRPGRYIPILIETAARNERLKKLGYHSSKEFDRNISNWLEVETARRTYFGVDNEDQYGN